MDEKLSPSKAGLGRGLGELLQGAKVPGSPSPGASDSPQRKEAVTPGLASLLRAEETRGKATADDLPGTPVEQAPPQPCQTASQNTLKLALLVADGTLLSLAGWVMLGPGSHGRVAGALAALAVTVGAGLGCLAWILHRGSKS